VAAEIWANIHAPDGAAFDQRLDALAATVCPNDPGTLKQRRADAVGALAVGKDRLVAGADHRTAPPPATAPQPGRW
jgi:hypothetical protein